jgi:tetratricopeptide (TPR) repeat protein
MQKGQKLMEARRFKEAEREFDLALASYSKAAAAYGLRGKVRYSLKNYPGAVEDFDQYLSVNPGDLDLTFLRGLSKSLLKPEDVGGACADFLKVKDRAKPLNMDKYCKGQEGWSK